MKEFIVKVIMELVDMVNNGIISFVVTVVATRYMTESKTDKSRIKERANASQTSAQNKIDSEDYNPQKSSEIINYIDIHNNIDCNIYVNINTDPEKDQ